MSIPNHSVTFEDILNGSEINMCSTNNVHQSFEVMTRWTSVTKLMHACPWQLLCGYFVADGDNKGPATIRHIPVSEMLKSGKKWVLVSMNAPEFNRPFCYSGSFIYKKLFVYKR